MEKVSVDRIKYMLESIDGYNATPKDGTTRVLFSKEELECREFLIRIMREQGLLVEVDHGGNIFATLVGEDDSLAPVWTGSHIDTVLNAGMFDGMAGVVAGIEALRILSSRKRLKRSVSVVIYTSEEPTRFGLSCLGSRLLSGDLTIEDTKKLYDSEGYTFYHRLEQLQFHPENLSDIVRKRGDVYANIELHIEQSPNLEKNEKVLGFVKAICAPTNLNVRVSGVQSHAGGTSMEERRDAFMAAAQMSLVVERLAKKANESSYTTGTVGMIDNKPGAVNVIPGICEFSIDIRGVDFETKDKMLSQLLKECGEVADERQVKVDIKIENHDNPAVCDKHILDVLEKHASGIPSMTTFSGAYHDALFVSRFAPTAMLFVPSKNGISHSKDEWTEFEDIEKGTQVLVAALEELANEI